MYKINTKYAFRSRAKELTTIQLAAIRFVMDWKRRSTVARMLKFLVNAMHSYKKSKKMECTKKVESLNLLGNGLGTIKKIDGQ